MDEPHVIIMYFQETSQMCQGGRHEPIMDSNNFVLIHTYSFMVDHVS